MNAVEDIAKDVDAGEKDESMTIFSLSIWATGLFFLVVFMMAFTIALRPRASLRSDFSLFLIILFFVSCLLLCIAYVCVCSPLEHRRKMGVRVALLNIGYSLISLLASIVLFPSFTAYAMKPAIYLRTTKPENESVTVKMRGNFTITIPEPDKPSRNVIRWDNIAINKERLTYRGETFDYLFYEGTMKTPRTPNFGWTLEKICGILFWNGETVAIEVLRQKILDILQRYGLHQNEINDFLDYWLGDDFKISFGKENFRYGIYPIPVDEMEKVISIETHLQYPEIVRVHFLVKKLGKRRMLKEPEYPEIIRSKQYLHEWGVMK